MSEMKKYKSLFNVRKIEFRQINKKKLVKNRWYLGRGRNSNIGLWDGMNFLTIGRQFDQYAIKKEPYYVRNEYISRHSRNKCARFFDIRKINFSEHAKNHFSDFFHEKYSGCFQPFMLIDEGKMIKSFGETGWDKTYGKKLSVERY